MGDNIHLGDRDGVRTPMQWSLDRNGGFSRADPAALVLPPIMDSLYGFQAVNVEAQARDPHSLLNWMRRMLTIREQQKAFGRGTLAAAVSGQPPGAGLPARIRRRRGCAPRPSCASPMSSRSAQAVELDLASFAGRRAGGNARRRGVSADRAAALPADPAALRLLLVHAGDRGEDAALAHTGARAAARIRIPSCSAARSRSCWRASARAVLEREVLPAYLPQATLVRQQGRDAGSRCSIATRSRPCPASRRRCCWRKSTCARARGADRYLLPFGFVSEGRAEHGAAPAAGTGARAPRPRASAC